MGKITGMEAAYEVPPKVLSLYEAVEQLIATGEDINSVSVSSITERAGIGKGTAYDYFDSKEDLIACALLHQIKGLSRKVKMIFPEEKSFAEGLAHCMQEIDKKKGNWQCFMHYVHIMTENSAYCQLARLKMGQKEFAHYLPMAAWHEIVERGREQGELRKDIPVEYMVYAIFSKLLTYLIGMPVNEDRGVDREEFRSYVYYSLINEVCVQSL